MVPGHASEILVGDAKDARLHQVLQRAVVLLQAELAEAEKRVRRAVLRRQLRHAPEGVAALRELVELVVRGTLIPVALRVVRPQLHRLGEERGGVVPLLGLTRRRGLLHDLVELRRARLPPVSVPCLWDGSAPPARAGAGVCASGRPPAMPSST